MRKTTLTALFMFLLFTSLEASAGIVFFDLAGVGGSGLLRTNELHAVSGTGSGGEIGPTGIQFDDVSKVLLVNVGWGSGQGFTDLTGTVNAGHIHQTTVVGAGINGTGGVLINLAGAIVNNSPNNGSINFTSGALTAAQEARLLSGDWYVNLHTGANGSGEIRGNLIVSAVPEPTTTAAFAVLAAGAFIRNRRKRSKAAQSPIAQTVQA